MTSSVSKLAFGHSLALVILKMLRNTSLASIHMNLCFMKSVFVVELSTYIVLFFYIIGFLNNWERIIKIVNAFKIPWSYMIVADIYLHWYILLDQWLINQEQTCDRDYLIGEKRNMSL